MGLDTTHDCWHGSYGSFHVWRTKVAKAAGLPELMQMQGYGGERDWKALPSDVLYELLNHSDADGELPTAICGPLADRLEQLLPYVGDGDGNWSKDAWRDKTRQFIDGLRLAASLGEDVEFH